MQHLATFEAQFMTKLRNTEAELKKKTLFIKKRALIIGFLQNII